MAKVVYDPTGDRKKAKQNPTDSKAVNEKIKNGDVKVKGKRKTATVEPEKPKAEKAKEKPTFTDEQFIVALRGLGKPASSREISDALGIADPEVGRQLVRSRMTKLAKEGKVVIREAPRGTKGKCVYSLT